jgi:hypothetical protein
VDITYGERVAHISFLAPDGGQVKSGTPRGSQYCRQKIRLISWHLRRLPRLWLEFTF